MVTDVLLIQLVYGQVLQSSYQFLRAGYMGVMVIALALPFEIHLKFRLTSA